MNIRSKNNNYILFSSLGEGSFGQTFKAIACNKKDQPIVAIKKFKRKNAFADASDEATYLSKITSETCSQYAVCLKELFKYADTFYIAMNYIVGVPLAYYMNVIPLHSNNSYVGRENRTDILIHLIKGLQALHSNGIAHQDIKPQNIMWDFVNNVPKYIDFGTSCLSLKGKEWNCGILGTPQYSLPNISKDFNGAKAHDIWSLGIVLYQWYCMDYIVYPHFNFYTFKINENLNLTVKTIINLMLEKERLLENWPKVLTLTEQLPIVDYHGTLYQNNHYQQLANKFIKEERADLARKMCGGAEEIKITQSLESKKESISTEEEIPTEKVATMSNAKILAIKTFLEKNSNIEKLAQETNINKNDLSWLIALRINELAT